VSPHKKIPSRDRAGIGTNFKPAGLVKFIIKNLHTNDYLTGTLKQFATSDKQLILTARYTRTCSNS
jgi:hypothetical protein